MFLIMPLSTEAESGVMPFASREEIVENHSEEMEKKDNDYGLENLLLSSNCLSCEVDPYDGIIVDPSCLPTDVNSFIDSLHDSLALWKSQERKGVWLKLPTENANLVFPAIEAGFVYHHAEPNYVMLTYWIPEVPCTLPSNASHQVGVGAFVLNEEGQVLAVQEKNGPLQGSGVWKMPTGLVNQGEDVHEGAVREVKEETGIDTEFLEVIGFRQGHQVLFEKSDIFFLCVLRPLSMTILKQDTEIEAAQWMDLEKFACQPFVQNSMLRKMVDMCMACTQGRYRGFGTRAFHAGSERMPSYFYYNVHDSMEKSIP
ncbi:hypothetical protein MARPO_0018s0016 [Marchantia polymorpha]|uniref:Nudix hydrolase domain-containing protein n=1 Tax=Marchantia polymorpha TaxID=3197 RepID=A0A2R6XFG8_MARPO|nr:hypothetical protein MARPO_0018s0016 [Marchantia polymorpha]|eukprot:PTQ44821.1 hypothetical protein MARPO_0018s0016 [Marchantia polymorpha]